MNKLAMKKLCGSLLLTALASGAALAQQPYGSGIPSGTDSTTGTMPGGAMPGGDQSGAPGSSGGGAAGSGQVAPMPGGDSSGMGAMPDTDQTDPMHEQSGAPGMSGSGAAGMEAGSSGMPSQALMPEIPGAAGPSDADPFRSLHERGGMSR
jgi:hypothetical protein